MNDERKDKTAEDINVEEHWVYVSQLEELISYIMKAGGNRVVVHILPDPYKFSV